MGERIRKNDSVVVRSGKDKGKEGKVIMIMANNTAIVEGINDNAHSFVELDYFPKNCINMLTKGDGIGLIGGISLNKYEDCDKYLNFVILLNYLLN